jgi:hypothetical protein
MSDCDGLAWNSKDHGSVLRGDQAPTKTIFPATNAEYPESSSHVFTMQGQRDNGTLSMAPAESSLLSPVYGIEQTVPDYTSQIALWESDYVNISAAGSLA